MIRAVLFDFDGTFADTAPDLALALNRLLVEEGMQPLPVPAVRAVASAGARGMVGTGFGLTAEDPRFPELRDRFLALYEQSVCVETRLFEGMPALLDELESRQMRWGIVTNKATRFTLPLVKALRVEHRAACVVCGDTTPRLKPAPDSLLHAAATLKLPPSQCIYVGDDLRDVQAARAAGMPVLAAGYGYLSGGDPFTWEADGVVQAPQEVLEFLRNKT